MATKEKLSILLVEDDENLGTVVKDVLEMEDYKVSWQKDGNSAIQDFMKHHYHLCVFDVMLPKKDGFTVATEARKLNPKIPIIFLTAKSMKEDRIKGFQSGADDYITKPFSTEEFLLRVKAVLKRCYNDISGEVKNVFEMGKYKFNYEQLTLTLGNDTKTLTQREADTLKLLCINKNEILTREMILKIIWGNDDYFTGRSMDVFIARLRKYLSGDPKINIVNIHGVGFKMMVE